MEVRKAIADIAEVRDRLATVQRFDGYSGGAAIASGLVAVGFGVVQALVAPQPRAGTSSTISDDLVVVPGSGPRDQLRRDRSFGERITATAVPLPNPHRRHEHSCRRSRPAASSP